MLKAIACNGYGVVFSGIYVLDCSDVGFMGFLFWDLCFRIYVLDLCFGIYVGDYCNDMGVFLGFMFWDLCFVDTRGAAERIPDMD